MFQIISLGRYTIKKRLCQYSSTEPNQDDPGIIIIKFLSNASLYYSLEDIWCQHIDTFLGW